LKLKIENAFQGEEGGERRLYFSFIYLGKKLEKEIN